MNFRVCTIAFLSLFAGVPFYQTHAASPSPRSEINWQTDLKKAHEESVRLNRPMLLVFEANWCTYCQKMEKTTLSTPLLVSYVNHSFVPVKLDLEKNKDVAKILGVKRVPCTVVLSPRADLIGKLVGFVDWPEYREALSKVRTLQRQIDRQQREATRVQPSAATRLLPESAKKPVAAPSLRS